MIPVVLIDSNTERRMALEHFLSGTGTYRVIALPSPEVTFNRSRSGKPEVIVVAHEEGQDGLLFLRNLRMQGVNLPVILVSTNYDSRISSEALQYRAEYMVMSGPAATWYPVLQMEISKALEIQRLREQVGQLDKKLTLVGSVTRHDVVNQLTAVNGYNELLGMMIEDPKMKSFLEKERLAIEKIRRQFQFAKDYQNLGTEPPRWQSIRSVVRRATESFDLKEVHITETCGNALVRADPFFEKAVFQLVDNAIRHGSVPTEIRIFLTDESDGSVLIVQDNGRGIPAGDKEKIFERGFGRYTGWGLFLVREILAITGITIVETGEPGSGARFEIHIPKDAIRYEGDEITRV
jgi:signal transduction histidine kinase